MRKLKVSPQAAHILRGGFMVANALMLSSALFLKDALPFNSDTYQYLALSQSLRDTCVAVLFFSIFGSALAQEYAK